MELQGTVSSADSFFSHHNSRVLGVTCLAAPGKAFCCKSTLTLQELHPEQR